MDYEDEVRLLFTGLALGIIRFEQSKTCPALIEVCYRGIRHCVEYNRQSDDEYKALDSFDFVIGLNYQQLEKDIVTKMRELGI